MVDDQKTNTHTHTKTYIVAAPAAHYQGIQEMHRLVQILIKAARIHGHMQSGNQKKDMVMYSEPYNVGTTLRWVLNAGKRYDVDALLTSQRV